MREFIEHHREKQAAIAATPVKTESGRQPKLRGFTRALERDLATQASKVNRNRRRRQRARAA